MRKILLRFCALAALALPSTSLGQETPLLLFGGDGHKDFLGCLNCGTSETNSVWNRRSEFGWENRSGKWGKYGDYGSKYGDGSACNKYASDPPVIVDRQGGLYGRLSVSKYVGGSVCAAGGAERVCTAVTVMCAHVD